MNSFSRRLRKKGSMARPAKKNGKTGRLKIYLNREFTRTFKLIFYSVSFGQIDFDVKIAK